VESDGILQSAIQITWSELAKVLEPCTYMSWKRILERSNAFEASDKSIAASIVYNGGVEMTEQVAVRNEMCFGCSSVDGLINSYIYSNFPKSDESMASCHPSSDTSGKGNPSFIGQETRAPKRPLPSHKCGVRGAQHHRSSHDQDNKQDTRLSASVTCSTVYTSRHDLSIIITTLHVLRTVKTHGWQVRAAAMALSLEDRQRRTPP
jgi:hypothetical protein